MNSDRVAMKEVEGKMNPEDLKAGLADRARSWVERLESRDPLPPIAPKKEWDPALSREIAASRGDDLFATPPQDPDARDLFRCGVLLWNDALDPSHTLSQKLHSTTGSYWHGLMHRREPDFGNSKYWFRRVGHHPAFEPLRERVILLLREFGDGYSQSLKSRLEVAAWDPFDLVDRCERAVAGKEPPEIVELLESIQLVEIRSLLEWGVSTKGVLP